MTVTTAILRFDTAMKYSSRAEEGFGNRRLRNDLGSMLYVYWKDLGRRGSWPGEDCGNMVENGVGEWLSI